MTIKKKINFINQLAKIELIIKIFYAIGTCSMLFIPNKRHDIII